MRSSTRLRSTLFSGTRLRGTQIPPRSTVLSAHPAEEAAAEAAEEDSPEEAEAAEDIASDQHKNRGIQKRTGFLSFENPVLF